jgi:hypothetical protein
MRYRLHAALGTLIVALVALPAVWPARGDSTPPAQADNVTATDPGPGDVPERYLGAWTGAATVGVHRFEVAVDVTGGRVGAEIGRSYLPVSDCRFALVLVRSDPTALVADGRLLPDGNQSCAERRVTLTPAGDGRMTYADTRSGAHGMLTLG